MTTLGPVNRLRYRNKSKQGGLAMVEFAVVLPFLLLMLASVSDIGYLLYHQSVLYKSVESGGRFVGASTATGSGLVDITAEHIQNTRNVVIYGNSAGVGRPVINDLNPLDILISCTNGTRDGHCISQWGLTPITVQVNYLYKPILGDLFDNVTGFNIFPYRMSAITIVESI